LSPGQSVTVTISSISCQNGTFTFSGSGGASPVTTTWSCTLPPPTLTVSPNNLSPTSQTCSQSGQEYICQVSVGETPDSQGTVNWSVSGSLSSFSPSSGTLSPGGSTLVTITIFDPFCSNITETFSGSGGAFSASAYWSCSSPSEMYVFYPTLYPTSNACQSTGGIYTCVEQLYASPCNCSVQWSVSSNLNGVTFNPSSGTVYPNGTGGYVTIAGLPCQNGTITFTGSGGAQPVVVQWLCGSGPNSKPHGRMHVKQAALSLPLDAPGYHRRRP